MPATSCDGSRSGSSGRTRVEAPPVGPRSCSTPDTRRYPLMVEFGRAQLLGGDPAGRETLLDAVDRCLARRLCHAFDDRDGLSIVDERLAGVPPYLVCNYWEPTAAD